MSKMTSSKYFKWSESKLIALVLIVAMTLSPLNIANADSDITPDEGADVTTGSENKPIDKITSADGSVQENNPETPAVPYSDIPQQSERPTPDPVAEELPYITYGVIDVKSSTSRSSVDLPVEIYIINPDNTQDLVKTTTSNSGGIKLPTGVYIAKVVGDSTIESDPIVLQEGNHEVFEASFSEIVLQPYSFASDIDKIYVEVVKGEERVWGPEVISTEERTRLFLKPGVYDLISPDQSAQPKMIDALIDMELSVLAIKRSDLFGEDPKEGEHPFDSFSTGRSDSRSLGLDGSVSFGDLQVVAKTYRDMPLSGVVTRIFNATDSVAGCSGGVATATTGTDGLSTTTLAPGDYKICSYKSFSDNIIWNTSITILGGNTTTINISFSRIQVYATVNDYISLNNGTVTFTQGTLGSDQMATYYVIPGTYSVLFNNDPDVTNFNVGFRDHVSVGVTFNTAPTFESVVLSSRVLANEQATVTIEAKDVDFDNMTFYTSVNLGSIAVGTPYWVRDSIWGLVVNYTAPGTLDFYEMSLGVQDTGNLFSNYTLYLSNRQSSATFMSREADFAPINTYTVVYELQTDSSAYYGYTGSDGNITFNILDGRYYYKMYQSNTYSSPTYKIDANVGTYSWQYNWSRVRFNTTAEWDLPFSATIRIYNTSNLASSLYSSSTSSTTGLGDMIVTPYTNYSLYASGSSAIWKYQVNLPEGVLSTYNFSFGGLAVYTFTGTTPENRYITLYNNTDGTNLGSTYTGTDGLHLYRLAPYSNYSVYDSSISTWFRPINVTAGTAVYIGNFTNSAPTISSIDTDPSGKRITSSQSVNITVTASDVDPIDKLDYIWSANVGSISGTGSRITYTAPANNQSYKITVVVKDQFGGNASTYIYVSDRDSTILTNVTKGDGITFNGYVYIKRSRDNTLVYSSYTGSDGNLSTLVKDGEYYIYVTMSGTTIRHDFIAAGSTYNFDFAFSEFIFNTTKAGNVGVGATVILSDPVTRSSIYTIGTSGITGLSSNVIVKPGEYDLKVYSSSSSAYMWVDNVSISTNVIKIVDIYLSEITVNVTTGYGNPMNYYMTYYNGTSGGYLGGTYPGADGWISFILPSGNYSFTVSGTNSLTMSNNLLGVHDTISLDFTYGTFTFYTNNGTAPVADYAYVYYQGAGSYFTSSYTGSDGVSYLHLTPGIYDVRIGSTWYYNQTLQPGQRTIIGNRLDLAPSIESVTSGDIGPSSSTTVSVKVDDLDYDFGQLTLTAVPNVGTIGTVTQGFTSTNNFYIDFVYNSPASSGLYSINITVSDGELSDTYFVVVSNNDNTVYGKAFRANNQPYYTSFKFYDHLSGNLLSTSYTNPSTGEVTINMVDGWYDVKVSATTDIWFYNVFVANNQILNLTAFFGDLNVYSTGTGGAPLNSFVTLRWWSDNTYITGGYTGSDGLITWVLAPGTYLVEVQEATSIFFTVVILGGQESFLGTDIPQLDAEVPDITYQYGTTGHVLEWSFTEPDPDSYIIYRDGAELVNGAWDGSLISISVDGLLVGEYIYKVFVNDTNGLVNVDFVKVTVTEPPGPYAAGTDMVDVKFGLGHVVSWNVSAVSPDKYVIYDEEVAVETGTWSNGTLTYDLGVRIPGTYNLTLFLNDTFGATFVHTSLVTFLPDPVPQFSVLPSDVSVMEWENWSFQWTGIDNNPATYEVLRDSEQVETGTFQNNTLMEYSDGTLDVGMYNFTIVLYDGSGNWTSTEVSVQIIADSSAPVISGPTTRTIYEGDTSPTEMTISDDLVVTYFVTDNGTQISSGSIDRTGSVMIDPSDFAVGLHLIVLNVTDSRGNSAIAELVLTVLPDDPPVFTVLPVDITMNVSEGLSVNWTATDIDTATYQILLNSSEVESGSWSSGVSYSYSLSSLSVGTYNLTVVLFDDNGNMASASITVKVLEIQPPVVTPDPSFISMPNDLVTGSANISMAWEFDSWEQAEYWIIVNGTVVDSGSWTSDPHVLGFSYSLNGTGLYTVQLVIESSEGAQLTDTVNVTLIGEGSSSSTTVATSFTPIYMVMVTFLAVIATKTLFRRRRF